MKPSMTQAAFVRAMYYARLPLTIKKIITDR